MIMTKFEVNGLILAGGRSRRMGGQDKGLLLLEGKRLIKHCISRLAPQVRHIFISANRHVEQYRRYGFPVLEDQFGDDNGPLAGLLRAFEYSGDLPILIAPCDAPFYPTTLSQRLIESFTSTPVEPAAVDTPETTLKVTPKIWAAIPHDGNRLQPLFGLYSPEVLPLLRDYLVSGERKVETWATSLPHVIVDFSHEEKYFMNVNTDNDLRKASIFLKNSEANKR